MPLFRRAPRLPDDVRDGLGLAGRRTLAVAPVGDGWAVATPDGLHVAREGREPFHRAWSDVDGARLDPETAELTVSWVDGTPATVLHLTDEGARAFPRVLHGQVQSSVVHSERVKVGGGATVRVVLRRGADGRLFTQVIGGGGVDLADPATATQVDAAEARVREAAGLS